MGIKNPKIIEGGQKITQEELENLQKLNSSYYELLCRLGTLALELKEAELRVKNVQVERAETLEACEIALKEYSNFNMNLGNKYGEHQVDLETGVLK